MKSGDNRRSDEADSNTIDHILMIGITVVIAALILLYLLGFFSGFFSDKLAEPVFEVINVVHGSGKLDSIVIVQNTGSDYPNKDLAAMIYRNNQPLCAVINTLYGHEFIPTHHYGVQYMSGPGCRGRLFAHKEMISVNLKNGSLHPGDLIEFRVYQKDVEYLLVPYESMLNLQTWYNEQFYSPFPGYRLISQHKYKT